MAESKFKWNFSHMSGDTSNLSDQHGKTTDNIQFTNMYSTKTNIPHSSVLRHFYPIIIQQRLQQLEK